MAFQQEFGGHSNATSVTRADASQTLAKRLLIVEDDIFLTLLLEEQLADMDYESRQASDVAGALALIQTEIFDGAILDINLAGETIYPVATSLSERNIPFAFSSGSGRAAISGEFRNRPTLGKPYTTNDLQRVLCAMFPPANCR
ncbi:MAG: response regulator [Acidocella sp.]|nr:response regulator [Acidocella sp.]